MPDFSNPILKDPKINEFSIWLAAKVPNISVETHQRIVQKANSLWGHESK